jgi:predicted ribosome quality control (RQC) complex YloA/Tae2 family protein
MHARSVPGSHLILRVPAGKEATQEDVQFAANLCVFFSKSRTASRWDVTVCSGKDVKKPKGSKPGQVMVMNERVVSGVPDQSVAAKEAQA